ncbi:transmembrane anterior posterior transformation protein 1 homolog [Babylonia areolata]|uniref:transmembrane anterior posterior transformation protein 1 homolog n=1 Tax=Babylonia areolata TaxID=304850 RepID=UPI003FD28049
MADVDLTSKASSKVPKKGEIPPRLRHRSRCNSESENGATADQPDASCHDHGDESAAAAPQPEEPRGNADGMGSQPSTNDTSARSHPDHSQSGNGSRRREPSPRKPYSSVLSLLGFELTRGYYLAGDETHYEERRERVYTFMSTPLELEKFCIFGFLQCVDTFLFFAAFLPIRVVIAVVHMLSYPCVLIVSCLSGDLRKEGKRRRILQPAQVCDMLKGLLLGVAIFCIEFIDTSRMYHMVRGQAVIKLYVFYNMLDLADRLVSGAGQDMLDALYWTATEPRRKSRRCVFITLHFLLALLYILIHTVLILGQATVLNVAFNSHNKALLTIMISNNFVEIKGSLFKRMDKNNLQQISCSDVKERFHYFILLFVVFVRNMTEFQWNTDQMWAILQDTLYVGFAEVVVDWVKHAFITKFNEIPSETYRTFKINLAQDILTSQEKYAHTDYSDQVCRRLGLTPIPLVCLLIQLCSKSIHITGPFTYLLLALFFLGLVSTKVLTSILLLSWGCSLLEGAEEEGHQTNPCTVDSQVLAKKDHSTKDSPATARDRHPSEKSSPQKPPPHQPQQPAPSVLRSVSAVETNTLLETVAGNLDMHADSDIHDTGWKLRSISDSVVEKQSQVLQRASASPLKEGGETEKFFSQLDGWEVESEESDSEFHSSLNVSSSSGHHDHASILAASTAVVDYDDEKKYK